MKNLNPVRGTYDYAPNVATMREQVRETILKNYQNNGFNLVITPILESLENLNSSEGGDNLRLIFKTIKRKDKLDLTKPNLTEDDITAEGLRYDLTVPLSRFYAGNRDKLPTPFKSIQIGDAFRAERPQRGRNRQFTQCDVDIFGDASINAELELLKTAIDGYEKLGFNNLILKINNRQILDAIVLNAGFKQEEVGTVCVSLDKLDKINMAGVVMELIEKGFEAENINKLADSINSILDGGLEAVKNYVADEQVVEDLIYLINTLKTLTNNKHEIKYDVTIVRGQGYYTGTVYEFYTEGFAGAIGAGGRYDKMVEKMVGVSVPAVGASIGFEPVVMLLLERGNKTLSVKQNMALIYDEDDDIIEVFGVKEALKKEYNVSLYKRAKNMKSFYEKIIAVADVTTSVKDVKINNPIKVLNK